MIDNDDSIKKILILLNDADPLLNRVTKTKLMKDMGWECIIAVSYDDAIQAFEAKKPDLVITEILILDYKDRTGIELVAELRTIEKRISKTVPIIVFSELDDNDYRQKALNTGATAFFSKNNISLNDFITEIQRQLDRTATQD